jgi:hypothetical protein
LDSTVRIYPLLWREAHNYAQINEIWEGQEKHYRKFLDNEDGTANRSPTPCPLGLLLPRTRPAVSRFLSLENQPELSGRNRTQTSSRRSDPGSSRAKQLDPKGFTHPKTPSPSKQQQLLALMSKSQRTNLAVSIRKLVVCRHWRGLWPRWNRKVVGRN